MNKSSILGLILGVVAVVVGMALKGASPMNLVNPAAFLIIIVGTVGAVAISFPMDELKKTPKLFKIIMTEQKTMSVQDLIPIVTEWANIARKEGLLALEDKVEEIDNDFLTHGMKMIIDGQPPEVVKEMLESDIAAMEDRHRTGSQIFTSAGQAAPTLGVLGAVIGLIAALGNLSDIEKLGHSIAAAFVATLLGIFTGYVLWLPFAKKLQRISQKEVLMKEIMMEAILSIQDGVSARLLEDKMLTYLPAKQRKVVQEAAAETINAQEQMA